MAWELHSSGFIEYTNTLIQAASMSVQVMTLYVEKNACLDLQCGTEKKKKPKYNALDVCKCL